MTNSDNLVKRLDERDKEVAPGNLYGLAATRLRELEAELAGVRRYLKHLGETIADKHYPDRVPEWRMVDDAVGMATQIDNMVSGMARIPDKHVIVPVEPTEAMICAGIAERHDVYIPEAWAKATVSIYHAMIRAATQETE